MAGAPGSPVGLTRLIVRLPSAVAEPFGAAWVELGAGAVERVDGFDDGLSELVVTLEDAETLADWQRVTGQLAAVFCEELGIEPPWSVKTDLGGDAHWQTRFIEYLQAEQVSERWLLCPVEQAEGRGQAEGVLLFEPSFSFGVGSHATTRLASRAVERLCLADPGLRWLDVGTGNGVLALVALANGASSVFGVDISELAVSSARHNATLNGFDDRFEASLVPLAELTEAFEALVANVELPTQLALAAELARLLAPGGQLLLTGYLESAASELEQLWLTQGLTLRYRDSEQSYALSCWFRVPAGSDPK